MIPNICPRANIFLTNKCVFRASTRRLTFNKCLRTYQNFDGGDIPTFFFQSSLPRHPIPQLQQTCENYLKAVRPLIDDKDYICTERIVNDFLVGEGARLQQMLIQSNNLNNRTSYIAKPWFDKYLSARAPLPIDGNPLVVMELDKRHEFNDQLIKTCNIVISTLRLLKSIEKNLLEPTIDFEFRSAERRKIVRSLIRWSPECLATKTAHLLKAIPKDMVQFQRIFGRTRIPENKRDLAMQHENSNHIIVMKNGRIYSVRVLNESGEIEPPEVIFNRINQIYQLNLTDTNYSVATLTTLERENWAKLRKYLAVNLNNENQFEQIDSALFCVSIENTNNLTKNMPQFNILFAGDGKNRWFDKSLTMAIDTDGTVGLSFEHSWGDGRTMQRINEEVYNDSTTSPFIIPNASTIEATTTTATATQFDEFVREIKFNVDAAIESEIKQAIENHTHKICSLKLNNFRFIKLNKKVCKNFKLSPDSIAQLGFQLAFYKQHGKFVSPYEPCNTQKFLHGRTEAIRPCTEVTQQLCYAICRKTENNAELLALINTCSQLHTRIIQQSANGQGFDRHLHCLRYLAEERGLDEPQLFRDVSFKVLTRNTIVSTNISSKAMKKIIFGPPTLDGYGIWYRIEDDGICLTISYYPEYANGQQFSDLLEESYNEILRVLENGR